MSQFLTRPEQDTLKEIDKIISWHKRNDLEIKQITITKKQKVALKRIMKKRAKGPVFSSEGEVNIIDSLDGIKDFTYKGIDLIERTERRRYNRKNLMGLDL